MQSEAERTRQSKRRSGQHPESVPISKQPSLAGSKAHSRFPIRVQRPSNTATETFSHSAVDIEDPLPTPTQKGKASEIQIMEPRHLKSLGRLSADPDSEDNESEPPQDEPGSQPGSPFAQDASKHLQSIDQKLYTVKDRKVITDGWQAFAEITVAMDKATQAKQPVILEHYPATPQKPPSRAPTTQDSRVRPKKPGGIFGYDKDFG